MTNLQFPEYEELATRMALAFRSHRRTHKPYEYWLEIATVAIAVVLQKHALNPKFDSTGRVVGYDKSTYGDVETALDRAGAPVQEPDVGAFLTLVQRVDAISARVDVSLSLSRLLDIVDRSEGIVGRDGTTVPWDDIPEIIEAREAVKRAQGNIDWRRNYVLRQDPGVGRALLAIVQADAQQKDGTAMEPEQWDKLMEAARAALEKAGAKL